MQPHQVASSAEALPLLVILFTALAAATLVPTVHRFIPRPIEFGVWIGFIALSVLRVVGVRDSRVNETTASITWAAGQLVSAQLSQLLVSAQGWMVANRFALATVMAIVAGADTLALAMVRSNRIARASTPRVHLGEWFEMPVRRVETPGDPLVELNRRLSAKTRVAMGTLAHSAPTRAVIVKPLAHVAMHVLGPGPARLQALKLALGFEGHREEEPSPAEAGSVRFAPAVTGPLAVEPVARPAPYAAPAPSERSKIISVRARSGHRPSRTRWRRMRHAAEVLHMTTRSGDGPGDRTSSARRKAG